MIITMPERALSKFAGAMYSEAMAKKEKTVSELRREREAALAKTDTELEQKYSLSLAEFAAQTEQGVQQAVSGREAELLNELREYRRQASAEVFDGAEKCLRQFVEAPAYKEYLHRRLIEMSAEFNRGKTVCTVRSCDEGLIKEISPISDMEILVTDADIIGGFTLKNKELEIYADCTLKAALEEQKKLFPALSGLIIG